MIPVEDAEHYYSKCHRKASAMAAATAGLAVRNIRLEMARRYSKLAGEGHRVTIAVLSPSAGLMPSSCS